MLVLPLSWCEFSTVFVLKLSLSDISWQDKGGKKELAKLQILLS